MGKNLWCIMTSREDSEEEARRTAETMRNCPHLVAIGYTSGTVYSIYTVPEHKRWWLEYPETMNQERGEKKYSVQVIENLTYPEELALKTPKSDKPPCGADCGACGLRERYGCDGCPAVEA